MKEREAFWLAVDAHHWTTAEGPARLKLELFRCAALGLHALRRTDVGRPLNRPRAAGAAVIPARPAWRQRRCRRKAVPHQLGRRKGDITSRDDGLAARPPSSELRRRTGMDEQASAVIGGVSPKRTRGPRTSESLLSTSAGAWELGGGELRPVWWMECRGWASALRHQIHFQQRLRRVDAGRNECAAIFILSARPGFHGAGAARRA